MLVPLTWKLSKQMMYRAVYERQEERSSGWKVHLLKRFFPLTRLKYPAVIGTFSWSSSAIKRKWLMESFAVPNAGTWVTPGDLARDYLAIKYANRRARCTTAQYQACVRDKRNPPLYAIPQTLEHALYVDVRSAYWSIVQAVGWDVNYLPGGIIGVGDTMEDFPFPDNKMARNCLVSCGLPSGFRFWDGAKLTFQNKPNRFVNLLLWRCVCDVLNAIACDFLDVGAAYFYTDGAIVPYSAMEEVEEIALSWGLQIRVKHEGRCIIHAPACYEFPDFKTKTPIPKRPISMNKVYDEHRLWLKRRFGRFANERVKYE